MNETAVQKKRGGRTPDPTAVWRCPKCGDETVQAARVVYPTCGGCLIAQCAVVDLVPTGRTRAAVVVAEPGAYDRTFPVHRASTRSRE